MRLDQWWVFAVVFIRVVLFFVTLPVVGEWSIVTSVSVCLSVSIPSKLHVQSLPISVHVTYGRGSVLLWRRSDTLCTSGFMDDVMFAHNGQGPDLQNILRLSYDNAKVTINLRRTSNSQNILQWMESFSWVRFTCKIVISSERVFVNLLTVLLRQIQHVVSDCHKSVLR